MKKIISLILALIVVTTLFASCSNAENQPMTENEEVTVRLGGLKGATSMGLVKLLDDNENGKAENKYEFTMATTADELAPKLLKGELDILAVPANLGSILYNNSNGAVQMVAISTLGVIYIAEKGGDTVKAVSDLKGKTIYATGKGTTPEYALTYILAQNGMDINTDVTVEWKSEPTEIISLMAQDESAVAMIPQPFVTVAQSKVEGLHIALDLTEEWNNIDNGSKFITAGIIVRKAFADEHPDEVKKFIEDYRASADYVVNNTAESSKLVEKYDIVKAPIAEKAIPYCNIVCITGEEMKSSTLGYLGVLCEQNPKAIGGKLPADDFFVVYE